MKHVVDVCGRLCIGWVVIRAVKAHQPVFEHLEQLVHLHGVHFADLVQKQHAAVRARDRALLGLRHAALSKRPRALIYGVVHAAEERVGNGALVKPDAGRVHLHKRRVKAKGRSFRALRHLKRQPRGARLAHARRAVYDYVLRVFAAQHRLKRAHALFLTDDLFKTARPHGLVERLGQMHRAQRAQPVCFRASPAPG